MSRERKRQTLALLLALLIHTLLLSMVFGGGGLGQPGLGLPWSDRRVETPHPRVVLVPTRAVAAVSAPVARVDRSAAGATAPVPLLPPLLPAPTPGRMAAVMVPEKSPPRIEAAVEVPPGDRAAPVTAPSRASRRDDSPPQSQSPPAPAPLPAPNLIALARSDMALPTVPSASSPETALPLPLPGPAGESAQAHERAKLDSARLEAQAAQAEAARQDAVRQAATRAEATRLEVERLEAARQEAAVRQELTRVNAARQEAARAEAARLESERQEVARQAVALQAAARQESARQEAAQKAEQNASQEAAAKREAVLRAIGRQLDEEADRRAAAAAARPPPSLLPSSSSARRGRLLGRTDANAELVLYAEAWSRKIQLNMTFEMVRDAARQPHTDPLVTVAIRSDGSVESVSFVRSSGVAALDEAIRRVVQSQSPYPVFAPGLAREFDVVEIRRTWHFDMAIRLY